MMSRSRFRRIYELATLLVLVALTTLFLRSKKKELTLTADLGHLLMPMPDGLFYEEYLWTGNLDYEAFVLAPSRVQYAILPAGPELSGVLSIMGVKIGMSFKDVQDLFGDSELGPETEPVSGTSLLVSKEPGEKAKEGEFPCRLYFGSQSCFLGMDGSVMVSFDDLGRVCGVEGYRLEQDGLQIAGEPRDSTFLSLLQAYPLFVESAYAIDPEGGYSTLTYPEIGLQVETHSCLYGFQLGRVP